MSRVYPPTVRWCGPSYCLIRRGPRHQPCSRYGQAPHVALVIPQAEPHRVGLGDPVPVHGVRPAEVLGPGGGAGIHAGAVAVGVQRPGPGVQEGQGGVPAAPVPVVGLHVVVDGGTAAHSQGGGLVDRVEGRRPALGRGAGGPDPDREGRAGRLPADVGGHERPAHAGHGRDPARREVGGRAARLHAADVDRRGRERPAPGPHRGQRGSRAAVEAPQALAEAGNAGMAAVPGPRWCLRARCWRPGALLGLVLAGLVLAGLRPVLRACCGPVLAGLVLAGLVLAAAAADGLVFCCPRCLRAWRCRRARWARGCRCWPGCVVRRVTAARGRRVRRVTAARGDGTAGPVPVVRAAAHRVMTWPGRRPGARWPAWRRWPHAAGCGGWTASARRPRCRSR